MTEFTTEDRAALDLAPIRARLAEPHKSAFGVHAKHDVAALLAEVERLAARQPAPVDAETTTEWGVRNPFGGHVETPGTEHEARGLARRRRETLVSREVTAWREVSRG